MVMETSVSPDSVGKEFVRQYYTLLNRAPNRLHKFYNQHSSFIHGELDRLNRKSYPVVGQENIHHSIQQLNLCNCHAHILQVDCQSTFSNGFVVQVTGELSIDCQPMRRFTQTFVLAYQGQKCYYVHNDIFRYQDEIVSYEEGDLDNNNGVVKSGDNELSSHECQTMTDGPVTQPQPQETGMNQQHYYNAGAGGHHVMTPQPQPPPTLSGSVHHHHHHHEEMNMASGDSSVSPHIITGNNATGQGQGQVLHNQMGNSMQSGPPDPPSMEMETQINMDSSGAVEDIKSDSDHQYESAEVSNEQNKQQQSIDSTGNSTAVSNEPKTYANLLKSGNAISYSNNNGQVMMQQQQQQGILTQQPPLHQYQQVGSPPQQQSPSQPQQMIQCQPRSITPINTIDDNNPSIEHDFNRSTNRGHFNRVPFSRGGQSQPPRTYKPDASRGFSNRNSFNDGDEPRRSFGGSGNFNFDTANQLFLGNLPVSATERDLREQFSQFGTVTELRVHSSKRLDNMKMGGGGGGRSLSNYAFITFETHQDVQKCLQARPITFPMNDQNGVTLNVEEKKAKDRQSFGGGGMMGGGGRPIIDNNRMRDNNGARAPRGVCSMNNSRGGGGPGISGGPTGVPPNRQNNNNYNNRNNNSAGGGPHNRGPKEYTRR